MTGVDAAAVIIGNEVLSAKVADENGPLLIQRLSASGIPLRSISVVPDDVDAIVEAVSRARGKAGVVFTSGGIGPTHDDLTVRAVALALGREVVRLPEMECRVRAHYGASLTAEGLRLADAPAGGYLLEQEGTWYPVLACDNIYLLPGVPSLFRRQLDTVLKTLVGVRTHLSTLFLAVGEQEIASVLDRVALAMPHVAIGSYPQFDRRLDFSVKVTVEHGDREQVTKAAEEIVRGLPPKALVRRE